MAEATRYGTCTNKSHCSLAYNRETIIVPIDGNCPECGRPLKVDTALGRSLKWLFILILLGALGAGGWYSKKNYLDPRGLDLNKLIGSTMSSPTPAGMNPSPTPAGNETPTASLAPGETPQPTAGAVDRPDLSESTANMQARKDVLKRIDRMPHLTEQQKTKLTEAVERARNMGCIFIIPFQSGQKEMGSRETEILVNGFKSAAIQQITNDPTVVFVILGYADKGDAGSGEKVSIDRAQSVLNTMKNKCGVVNVMYSVGMGGAEMYEGKTPSKNRLVEIWVAFP